MRRITIEFLQNAKGDVEIGFDMPIDTAATPMENKYAQQAGFTILALLQSGSIGSAIAAGGKGAKIPSVEELKKKAMVEVDIRRAGK